MGIETIRQHTLIGFELLGICACGFLAAFGGGTLRDLMQSEKWLQIPDAIGLALFCTTGLHLSWTMGQPPAVAVMMGIITGTLGGVLRDMACNEIPSLFNDHRPYAVCALAGGLGYAGLAWLDWRLPEVQQS